MTSPMGQARDPHRCPARLGAYLEFLAFPEGVRVPSWTDADMNVTVQLVKAMSGSNWNELPANLRAY